MRSASAFIALTFWPSMKTVPEVGSISRLIWRISVDLPDPLRPMMQKISPRPTLKDASCTPTTQSNSSRIAFFDRPLDRTASIA